MLRSALDGAVRDGLLARNPAAVIHRPGVERTEARHLSPAEVRRLFSAAGSSRYHRALVLIAATGMRRGECLALHWADIDHDAEVAPVTSALLTAQRKARVAERLHAGSVWTDTGHVFTTESGQPVDPRNLYRVVQAAALRAGLKDVGVQSLRHSAATAMLEAGVNIKAEERGFSALLHPLLLPAD